MTNREKLFAMAGLIAAQEWEIDIKDIEVVLADTPDPMRTSKLLYDHPGNDAISDEGVIEFKHWRKEDKYDKRTGYYETIYDLWIGYSDITNTLAICVQDEK